MLPQTAAFAGIAFSPDGKSLWTSGGNDDSVYRYAWANKTATLVTRLELQGKKESKTPGTSYPAGLAFSPDGKYLFVAENLGDGLVVIETESSSIVQRVRTGRYPYAVAVDAHGAVYVSCWGEQLVNVFRMAKDGFLTSVRPIASPRHPSAMVLSRSGSRLYVASATTDQIGVIDTRLGKLVHTIRDAPPSGPHEGSTPNALALSLDGTRLYIAEAHNNAVAVADVATNHVIGRMPVEWYPTVVLAGAKQVIVVSAKGKGTRPNPERAQADQKNAPGNHDYTLGHLEGSGTA